jgi:hypothetical protein
VYFGHTLEVMRRHTKRVDHLHIADLRSVRRADALVRQPSERGNAGVTVALAVTTLAVAVVLLARCAGGDTSAAAKSKTTTATQVPTSALTSVSSTTTPISDGSPPTVAPSDVAQAQGDAASVVTIAEPTRRGLDTPQAASRNLYDAWRENDRIRALDFASLAAVDTLFSQTWGAEIGDDGCIATPSPEEFRCIYVRERKAWVAVIVGNRERGFRTREVISVTRSASSVTGNLGAPTSTILDSLGGANPDPAAIDDPLNPDVVYTPDTAPIEGFGEELSDGTFVTVPVNPLDPVAPLETQNDPTQTPSGTDGAVAPGTSDSGAARPQSKKKTTVKPKKKVAKKPKAKSAVSADGPAAPAEPDPPPPPPPAAPAPPPADAPAPPAPDGAVSAASPPVEAVDG